MNVYDSNSDKVVIVTGGNRGLGLALVEKISQSGFKVIAAARNRTFEIDELTNNSSMVFFEKLDLKDSDNIHSWSKRIIDTYGIPYALINNAAIAHDGVLGTMHESQIQDIITGNVTGTII